MLEELEQAFPAEVEAYRDERASAAAVSLNIFIYVKYLFSV